MTTVAEKLHKWSLQELNLVSEGTLSRIPKVETFQILTKGRNKKIWNYVINHVRAESSADKVRRTLFLKKKLKGEQDNIVCFPDDSINHEKLRDSLSKTIEKRKYLMRSLSTIEERILNLDHNVRKTKNEIFQINQKTALLEHLKKIYDEKNSNLEKLNCHISSFQHVLNAYQASKVLDKKLIDISYDFMFDNKSRYDENLSTVKDLVLTSSSILEKQFNQDTENMNTLKENYKNNFTELKKCNVILIDFIMLLKEMSKSDLQQFTNLNSQNLSVKEFILKKSKESRANDCFAHLKCDYIYNTLNVKKSKDKIKKYSAMKSKASKNAVEILEIPSNDLDYETKIILFEKQTENYALILSNKYLENYLENVTNKSEMILKKLRQNKLLSKDINPVIHRFHKDADLTFNLLYSASSVTQKVSNNLENLKLFAFEELFKVSFPEENSIIGLKDCFSSERRNTWNYCNKTKIIQPFFTECTGDNELPIEDYQCLNIQPYQDVSGVCENWAIFKQKLQAEIVASTKMCITHNDDVSSEVYSKVLNILEKSNFTIEKGMKFLTYGATCCQRNKSLIYEWWNQNAQYIPHIEYEGKTLKMWIDILSVLSDYEFKSHV